jgi:hypothetical protein
VTIFQSISDSRVRKPFRLYGYAFLISFTGSLPVGTLNVSITDLVIDGNVWAAVLFGLGAILVEVSIVRIALVTVKRLEGMGTFVAFVVYGVTGHLLIMFLRTNQNLFNWLAGIALLVTGLVQVPKTLRAFAVI